MICPNCGAQISDGGKFCGICGSPTPVGSPAIVKKSGSSRFLLIILGGVAIIAIIATILIFRPLFKPDYKTPIKNMVKFANNRNTDIEEYDEICSGDFGQFAYEQTTLSDKFSMRPGDWKEERIDWLEERYDNYEDKYGNNWRISYEFKHARKLDDSKIDYYQNHWESDLVDLVVSYYRSDNRSEELIECYEYWYEKLNKMKVTDGYDVRIKLTIEGENGSDSTTENFTILKIGNKWLCDTLFYQVNIDMPILVDYE